LHPGARADALQSGTRRKTTCYEDNLENCPGARLFVTPPVPKYQDDASHPVQSQPADDFPIPTQ
ncbi:MAG: hypothetical protein P8M20_02650, partial [Planctomycetaceae bacterium]|nr:hypothetical protein [Planctomycetaceae bacterium]